MRRSYGLYYSRNSDILARVRPRDWNLEAVEHAVENSPDRDNKLYDNLMAYYAYLDRGNPEATMAKIIAAVAERTEPTSIERTRKQAYLEYAFVLARDRKDIEASEAALETAEAIKAEGVDRVLHRANAAISLAKDDWNSAISECKLAIAAVDKDVDRLTSWAEAELEWIGAIVEDATAKAFPQGPSI